MIFRQLFDKETSTYTYLLADEETREAVLIDPVNEQVPRDLKLIGELGLNLLFTLETHVHADHVTGSGALREATGSQIAVPSGAGVRGADRELSQDDVIQFGKHRLVTIELPGHTASCRGFLLDGKMVFTGDTLFIRGTGRTDFQGGSAAQLYHSITTRLFTLPEEVLVYPGHDYRGNTVSTIGEEKRFNPRLAGKSVDEYQAIMASLNLANPKHIHEAVPGNLRCGLEAPEQASFREMDVHPAWVADHLNDVTILDVRGPKEYHGEHGHIPGAMLIPLGELDTRLDEVPRCKPLMVNCHSGGRSLKAVKMLRRAGLANVWNIAGGILAWNKGGYTETARV
ncbi:MAG: MBL fold metallo-hydrolase [Acidobacteriota bacterium]|nr:MBL fold metallo-hydrolase [Acidobacteriota bacterium]